MLCYSQYTTVGDELYITIGNFDTDENTNYISVSNSNAMISGYYLDDAFVYKCDEVSTAEAGDDKHICRGDSMQIGMPT